MIFFFFSQITNSVQYTHYFYIGTGVNPLVYLANLFYTT